MLLALLFVGLVPPPSGGQTVAVSDLEAQHDRLDESGRRMRIRMDQAIQERVDLIRGRARTKAAYWREEGMSDYEVEEYRRLIDQLRAVHGLLRLDFGTVDGIYRLTATRLQALDVVYRGRIQNSPASTAPDPLEQQRINSRASTQRTAMLPCVARLNPPPLCGLTDPNDPLILDAFRRIDERFETIRASRPDTFGRVTERDYQNQLERDTLSQRLTAVHLAALAASTPEEGEEQLRQFRGVIETIAGLDQSVMEARADDIDREMEYFIVSMIPLLGDALAVVEAVEGRNALGQDLNWVEQAIAVLGALGSLGDLVGIMRNAGNWPGEAMDVMSGLTERIRNLTPGQRAQIADQYPGGLSTLDGVHGMRDGWRRPPVHDETRITNATNQLEALGDITARDEAFTTGRLAGQAKTEEFTTAVASGDPADIARSLVGIQSDKHALQVLTDAPQETIRQFRNGMQDLYDRTDVITKESLIDTYVDGYAQSRGVDLDQLSPQGLVDFRSELGDRINIVPVSNPVNPLDPLKPSFDRDVVAKVDMGDGVVRDVPSRVLQDAYGPAFYEVANGVPPATPGLADQFMLQTDQVATDALSSDAYGGGAYDLLVAIGGNERNSVFRDPEQIGQVFAFKANERFDIAEEAIRRGDMVGGEEAFEEGFRQLVKQYDKQIGPRVDAFNVDLRAAGRTGIEIPPDIQEAQRIMSQIGDGMTPAGAMQELARLGMTPREVSERMGGFVTDIHQYRGAANVTAGLEQADASADVGLLLFPRDWRATPTR